MKSFGFLVLAIIGLGLGGFWLLRPMLVATQVVSPTLPPSGKPTSAQSNAPSLEYHTVDLKHSLAHVLIVPSSSAVEVIPAIADTLQPLGQFAQQQGAIAAINAGFFDPANQKTTSYVVVQGRVVADPSQNERLTHNPKLAPYLAQILNRSEWRRYRCGSIIQYAITLHQAPVAAGCQLLDAVGGGPQLLPELTAEAEGFFKTVQGTVVRDAIGMNQANARTAVGLTADGSLVWVMVAQKAGALSGGGLSLPELASFLKQFGVTQALNLDGGSSSSFFFKGKTSYGKRDETGNPVQRPLKSILLVRQLPVPTH